MLNLKDNSVRKKNKHHNITNCRREFIAKHNKLIQENTKKILGIAIVMFFSIIKHQLLKKNHLKDCTIIPRSLTKKTTLPARRH